MHLWEPRKKYLGFVLTKTGLATDSRKVKDIAVTKCFYASTTFRKGIWCIRMLHIGQEYKCDPEGGLVRWLDEETREAGVPLLMRIGWV